MGVPKFYRWLSERYPCINENVNQYNMPEFDNFYVDMNGVFHICSHPSDDIHFRLSESQIFENIAIYIEFLFNLVQPRKVFFLSVDGVAPRSKMNQQRSRRYKTAKEAIEKEEKAKRLGESLPQDPRFDSNCITPGTEFMAKLHDYMLDFIGNKVNNNQSWREVEVIYTGYDVPGEGEHKIMDYIRHCRTKDTFDKNVRHCLYGLDADLINLGLSCHEPYFSLLREEVVFTKNSKRHCDPFKTNFQLLHLSILRDYLDREFEEVKSKLKFGYNLENIIDDWILMNFLIGNDFLPHVPKFHVDKGSIQILYDSYKQVLPTFDGYLNEGGTIHLERFRIYLQKLSDHDMELFSGNMVDLKYFNQDYNNITFGDNIENVDEPFEFDNEIESTDSDDEDDKANESADDMHNDSSSEEDIDEEFTIHKNNYYRTKLHFKDLESDVLKIVNEYIKGVQWVLFYYFNGCVSWNWYYPYYYAPYVSDLSKFDVNDFGFQQSLPFQPLMQLLAVIPQASKDILPKAFQKLTYNADSPLIDYFPKEVVVDLNEKIHDYEAIILIPFIDETILTYAFKLHENELTAEELHRNQFGSHHSFIHTDVPIVQTNDQLQTKFPNVRLTKYKQDYFVLPPEMIFKGVRRTVNLKDIIGFPTLNGIKYKIRIDNARLKVFRFASQNPSMLLTIECMETSSDELMNLARTLIGQMVYVNWPLLSEAKLVELLDSEHKYVKNSKNQVSKEPLSKYEIGYARQMANCHCSTMRNKKGVILDEVHAMAKITPLQSQKYIITGGKVILHKEWSKAESYIPLEFVIRPERTPAKIPIYKSLNTVFTKGKSFFLIDQPYYGYNADVIEYVKSKNLVKARVRITTEPDFFDIRENYHYILDENYVTENRLIHLFRQKLKLNDSSVRRLLGSVLILCKDKNKGNKDKRINVGLKLKYRSNVELNIKPYCIPGYSMVDDRDMFYNLKVLEVLENYHRKYPCIFDMIASAHKPIFELNDLFPDPSMDKGEKAKKLGEIKDWIDSLELSKAGHLKSDSQYLDNCIVKAIEETIESHSVFMSEESVYDELIPPGNFYISEFVLKGSSLPDPTVKFFLLDRVVNIKRCIAVPYGAKGTVIGIYRKDDQLSMQRNDTENVNNEEDESDYLAQLLNSVIEVMFDESFDGGFKTRSTKPNVFKMQASWLINVTYGSLYVKNGPSSSRNNYQPLQGTSNVRAQAQTSNSYLKASKQQGHNHNINNNKQVALPTANGAPNSKPNQFNHSENSPFKILTKNTQTTSNMNPIPQKNIENYSTIFPELPPVFQKPKSSVVTPSAFPSIFPNSSDIAPAIEMIQKLGINMKTTSQAPPSHSLKQNIPPAPPPLPPPSFSAIMPNKPPEKWIQSAKKKAKETQKSTINSRTFYPSKNVTNHGTGGTNGTPALSIIESLQAPANKRSPPVFNNDFALHPSVNQLFQTAISCQNNQKQQLQQQQNHQHQHQQQQQHIISQNYQHNNRQNKPRRYREEDLPNAAYTGDNSTYVSLNKQSQDVKQFVPIAVARRFQHERKKTSKAAANKDTVKK